MARIAFPPETFVRFLLYLAGILSTVVGSWVASKIHAYHDNRRLHHDDLKQKVLVPLLDGIQSHYAPLLSHTHDVVQVQHGQLRRNEHAKVTEDAEAYGPRIQSIDPASTVEAAVNTALLEDARRNHYRNLVEDWEVFRAGWTEYARKCEEWVIAMAARILNDSGLPSHPAPQGPYVMESNLAVFLYLRLLGRPSSTLRKDRQGERYFLVGVGTQALGSEVQIDGLLSLLNSLMETQQGTARSLLNQSRLLEDGLRRLLQKLSLAAAERSFRGRCRVVRFFR